MDKEATELEQWRSNVQQDITDLKNAQSLYNNEQTKMKDDIRDLQFNDKMQDKDIANIKEAFAEIKDDTNWIRRKITGAIITAIITAIIAGIIGIAIANIFGS